MLVAIVELAMKEQHLPLGFPREVLMYFFELMNHLTELEDRFCYHHRHYFETPVVVRALYLSYVFT